ncbi:SMR domain-containing protein [Drosera capensis]
MRNLRKKKRAQEGQKRGEGGELKVEKERVVVSRLVEAFGLASVEEATAAYREANGDADRAAEILTGLLLCDDNNDNDDVVETETETVSAMSCSSSSGGSGLGSSSSDGNGCVFDGGGDGDGGVGSKWFRGGRGKKAVAATGMVANMMGKGYLGTKSRMSWRTKLRETRGWSDGRVGKEEAELSLFSLLYDGDGCDVSMDVVKDVLGFCGYDVEKALDVLLDLYSSTREPSANDRYSNPNSSSREYSELSDNVTDWAYDSTSHSSDRDTDDNAHALDYSSRNYLEALLRSSSSSERHPASQTNDDLELPEKVLRSLFNIPESSQRDPGSMNWKKVVKQVESFAQKRVGLCPPGSAGAQQVNYAKGAEYQAFREPASHHWDSVKICYQKAAVAHSNGAREYASYLSDQAKLQIQQARKEDEKASMETFNARNKGVENVITIDLHGQHVKQAIRLVKLHLLFGTYISSVRYLRVITGCGTGGLGKSKLKESVIDLLDRESIQWKEENRGAVAIRLDGQREFSFLGSGSDSD